MADKIRAKKIFNDSETDTINNFLKETHSSTFLRSIIKYRKTVENSNLDRKSGQKRDEIFRASAEVNNLREKIIGNAPKSEQEKIQKIIIEVTSLVVLKTRELSISEIEEELLLIINENS